MPANDRIVRNATQRAYVARNRERINNKSRKNLQGLCKHCGAEFRKLPANRQHCLVCAPAHDAYAKTILRNFNMSRPEWNALYLSQGGICAMMDCDKQAKAVDHDHATGKVRALLCIACNVAVGVYENRADAIRTYLSQTLEKHPEWEACR